MEANNKSNLTELVKQITEVSMQVEEGVVKSVTIKNIVPYTPMIESGTGYTNQDVKTQFTASKISSHLISIIPAKNEQ
jgi:hypothetical protein